MTLRGLSRFAIWIVILSGLLWRYAPWPNRTFVLPEQNCQLQIPYNWTIKNKGNGLIVAERPSGGSFVIEAKPILTSCRIDDPAFSDALKNKLIADGHEIVSESREPFQGRSAYTYTMRKVINGKSIYTYSVNFIAGAYRYSLAIAKKDSEPQQDSQLLDAFNSFALIETPKEN